MQQLRCEAPLGSVTTAFMGGLCALTGDAGNRFSLILIKRRGGALRLRRLSTKEDMQ